MTPNANRLGANCQTNYAPAPEMSWGGIVTESLREELRGPSDKRRQCSSYFDAEAVGVAGPLSKRRTSSRMRCATPSNGHNVVIILPLAIPRTNCRDARQEPRRLKEARRNILFCVRGLPPLFQAVPRSSTQPRPRVTRIEDSRHREQGPTVSAPSLRSHHSFLPLPGTRSGFSLQAVLPIA